MTRPKGGRSSIFVTNVDGTGGYSLVDDQYIDQAPAWSPDGTQIAFVSYRAARLPGGETGYPGTFIMDANDTAGTTIRQVGDVFDVEPDWSPDGTQLAVSNTAWTGGLLRLIDVSTGVGTPLGILGQHPTWTPDGEYLVYSALNLVTLEPEVRRVKVDGSGETSIPGTGKAAFPRLKVADRLPDCPLSLVYEAGENLNSTEFRQWLIEDADPEMRESCLGLYKDVIFLAMYHELGEGQYWYSLNSLDSDSANDITAITGTVFDPPNGDPRTISSEEIASLSNAPATPSLYYMYTRTIANGMLSYANENHDPFGYFITNFNESMSDKWEEEGFCSGTEVTIQPRPTPDGRKFEKGCAYLGYWTTLVSALRQNNPEWDAAYLRMEPVILSALADAANGAEDPTQGALGARPINRTWVGDLNRDGTIDNPHHPVEGETPYIFRAYMTRINDFDWQLFGTCPQCETYPVNPPIYVTTEGRSTTLLALNVTPSCYKFEELLSEVYMRNLRDIYGPTVFANLPNFPENHSYFNVGAGEVRFGLSWDQPYGVFFHALNVPADVANFISWQTFIFTRPERQGDPVGRVVRPITVREHITIANGERVEPVTCNN